VSETVGTHRQLIIPLLKEWLRIDPARKHYVSKRQGAPRMYVFSTCVNVKREIEGWAWKTLPSGKRAPVDKDDHLISGLLFFVARDPHYMGEIDYSGERVVGEGERGVVNDEQDRSRKRRYT
jgi:hypothetical protein